MSFDGQLVRRPSPGLIEVSREYVCVRVTDMRGVDLSVWRFDYDLTFAALVANADGTLYHQYGNRGIEHADTHLSLASFEALLRGSLEDHAAYVASKARRKATAAETIEGTAQMQRRAKEGKLPECFHCHMVNGAHDYDAQAAKRYDPDSVWRWPPSSRLGLTLAKDDQTLVEAVADGSAAARAGLAVGDRLVRVGTRRVRSEGDVQWVLEELPSKGGKLPVVYLRGDAERQTDLTLAKGWKEGTPEEVWRNSIFIRDPKPGFGGPLLSDSEKRKLGIAADVAAFRVNYIVTWGEEAATGRAAQAAGIRKGDVVLSVAGKSDFLSPKHFQSWFRLTQKAGRAVAIEVLQGGEKKTLRMTPVE